MTRRVGGAREHTREALVVILIKQALGQKSLAPHFCTARQSSSRGADNSRECGWTTLPPSTRARLGGRRSSAICRNGAARGIRANLRRGPHLLLDKASMMPTADVADVAAFAKPRPRMIRTAT
jgi:hypothetical protein